MSLPLLTSPSGQDMLGYVTPIYGNSRYMQSVYQAEGLQFDSLMATITDILNQFYVDTATWALSQWESELNLAPNDSLTTDQRRQRIKSKLRGYGTATTALIKTVAQAYERGEVDVIEDFAKYTVHIRFVDVLGIPSNISDLQTALRAIIPAHLDIVYEYQYVVYSDIDGKYTYDQLDSSGLTYGQLMTKLPQEV
ncbi:hypothetical protein AAC03nite_20040 [Alicyclobacillus acidoterrestris]|nr:hypothetical protein AAC03nite_20040 [Alicyclobacillus acidoterrestris]